ncbi:MAG: calcium/sodium antiporter [Eubacterium sp.]|nr:calcium/sodium antiporter [Eubacterium sp.]
MAEYIQKAPIFIVVILLVLGFVCLIKGADYFVEGSSSIAKRFNVPSIIIGLTIVAMGTSLPETAVSVVAAVSKNNELAISNVVGSNIFNLMVVIGVCCVLMPILVDDMTIKWDIPFSLICAGLLFIFGSLGSKTIGRYEGALLLALFVYFLYKLLKRAKENRESVSENEEEIKLISPILSIVFILAGAAAIALGGQLSVKAASRIAIEFGMSQTLVGLTIVSIGTSLPELCTSFIAAKKGEIDMALGNAIGSNIFNILLVLGISSVITPITFLTENAIDFAILIAFTIIIWIIVYKKKKLTRINGILMLVLYAAYTAYIIIR